MRLREARQFIARPSRLLIALVLVCLAQGGCVYRMAIQQGNFLEPRLVDKLEIGMTRAQVRYLLGTPMVPATFDADRWDYLYYLRKGRVHAPVHRRLTVFFAADKVARVEKEGENAAPITEPTTPVPASPPRSGA
jgi:outer membrane protein assembly factor BamE